MSSINLYGAFEELKARHPGLGVSVVVGLNNYHPDGDRVLFEAYVHPVGRRCERYEGASLDEVMNKVRAELLPKAEPVDAAAVEVG